VYEFGNSHETIYRHLEHNHSGVQAYSMCWDTYGPKSHMIFYFPYAVGALISNGLQ